MTPVRSFALLPILLLIAASTPAAKPAIIPIPTGARPAAPGFTLTDLAGRVHRLSDYRGKTVVVNFWATWCAPCRNEMPSLQRAHEALGATQVVVLAIDIGEETPAIRRFASEVEVDFPLLLDRDQAVLDRWRVRGLPTTFIVDPQGRIAYKVVGDRQWDDPATLDAIRALRPTRPADANSG